MNFEQNFYNFSELQSNSDDFSIHNSFIEIPTFNIIPENINFFNSLEQSKIELSETYNDDSSSNIFIIIDNKDLNKVENQKLLGNNNAKNKKKYFSVINKEKSLLGRKKKFENIKSKHNKFSDDNLRRKVKHLVIRSAMNYINEKIETLYNGKIGNNIYKKKFLILNKNQKANATIDYNKAFLNKKLGNILSDNISKKYNIYKEDHNKSLVKYLINEKDINKKIFFNNFFNLTFLQCLKHYSGEEFIKELNGAKCFDEERNTLQEEDDYIPVLENYIKNYEDIIMNKNSRKKRLSKKNNN
jgi:hypothetical protein